MSPVPISQLDNEHLPFELGRYTLLRVLGDGGMARIFFAELRGSHGFRKAVVVKVIRDSLINREHLARTLVNEARLGGMLHHPNVVETYDFNDQDGQPYVAMEFVDGVTLDQLLEAGPLPPSVVLRVGMDICAGLHHAHELRVGGEFVNLVHRDMKPSNVIVSRGGVVKLLDFGLAKATSVTRQTTVVGTIKGTPMYMSPEQSEAETLDRRSDLFAVGCIIYEMATGKKLLSGDTLMQVMMSISRIDTTTEEGSFHDDLDTCVRGLGEALEGALRFERDERYRDAMELSTALKRIEARAPERPRLDEFMQDHLRELRLESPLQFASTPDLEAVAALNQPARPGQFGFEEPTTPPGLPASGSMAPPPRPRDARPGTITQPGPTPIAANGLEAGAAAARRLGFADDDDDEATRIHRPALSPIGAPALPGVVPGAPPRPMASPAPLRPAADHPAPRPAPPVTQPALRPAAPARPPAREAHPAPRPAPRRAPRQEPVPPATTTAARRKAPPAAPRRRAPDESVVLKKLPGPKRGGSRPPLLFAALAGIVATAASAALLLPSLDQVIPAKEAPTELQFGQGEGDIVVESMPKPTPSTLQAPRILHVPPKAVRRGESYALVVRSPNKTDACELEVRYRTLRGEAGDWHTESMYSVGEGTYEAMVYVGRTDGYEEGIRYYIRCCASRFDCVDAWRSADQPHRVPSI